jgi:hypothetical protein
VSAFLSEVAREVTRASGSAWLPGSMTLVVLALALVLLVAREVSRGVLAGEREQRARSTAVVVVPLVLCAALAIGARLIELVT